MHAEEEKSLAVREQQMNDNMRAFYKRNEWI